jgi:glyoxylase-like metal-dependent hydrolase (beta-lactamase superfamily II)
VTSDDAQWLIPGIGLIDLHFQGVPHVIGAYVVPTDDGVALVEVGPSTTLPALRSGLDVLGFGLGDVRHLLVTHIHLDHAGATGLLLREAPQARVYVHEIGAPHLIDPTNLVRSATRIYGDAMETLWGAVVPVPAEQVTTVADGDVVRLGERELHVLYTPGHASHHVAYHDAQQRAVFTGDVAGIRIPPAANAFPPTPPPDIDIPRWHASIDQLRGLRPERLLLTHFGAVEEVDTHLAEVDRHLDEWVESIERLVRQGKERDAIVEWLESHVRAQMDAADSASLEPAFALATPYGMAVDGLLRYLRKRDEAR